MSGKTIIDNRKARHEFMFLEKYEAGIELRGTEVKSLRAGKGSLQDAYARIENGQLWLYNLHISAYAFGNINNHEEKRPRRLLLHKSEIARLYAAVREKGLTLVAEGNITEKEYMAKLDDFVSRRTNMVKQMGNQGFLFRQFDHAAQNYKK